MNENEYQLQISLIKEAMNCKLPTDKEKQLALFSQLEPNTMSALAFCIASGFESKILANGVHSFVEAVVCLNCYAFENLRDLFWSVITADYDEYVTGVLIELINDDALKVKVLECLKDEVQNLNDDDKQAFGVDNGTFIDFCNKKIAYIQNHDLYSIEAIKARQNDPLKAVEDRDSRLELPVELQSSEAQDLLKRAVEAGLCKPDGQGRYKWLKSMQLCAYFAVKMSDYLELSNRKQGDNYTTNWKPFVRLFGFTSKKLADNKQDYQKGGSDKPTGYEQVDALFECIE